jgi:hypothetical protein
MTRIFTVLAIAVLLSFTASAQTSKGTVLLGGSLSFYHSKYTSDSNPTKTTTFALSPGISKFYKDNRVVGASLSYSRTTGSQNGNSYGLSVFLRQYLPIGKDFFLFADESLYGNTSKYRYSGSLQSRTDKAALVGVSFNPGLAYAVNKKFQLEIGLPDMVTLDYNHYQVTNDPSSSNNTTTNTLSFRTGLSEVSLGTLSFGVKVALN